MFGGLEKFFKKRSLAAFEAGVVLINELEPAIQKLTDDELAAESAKLKAQMTAAPDAAAETAVLGEILPCAFALVREAAKRALGQRPFDVQLLGGMVLHQGAVAEMMTGEGKTLAAVAPAYLNALAGRGVHIVTVNEYLARRDAVWMGQIYRALGLSVACLVPNAAFLYDPEWKVPEDAEQAQQKKKWKRPAAFWCSRIFCGPSRGAKRMPRTSPTVRTTSSVLIICAIIWCIGWRTASSAGIISRS